jgi:hypothetical protein
MFEMKMVEAMHNEDSFELSRAMKAMIQIQQNRFKTTIDEKSLNNNNANYYSTIEEILNRQYSKKDEVCMNSKIDAKMSIKSNETIMPTMATLSHSSNLEDSEKKSMTIATLLVEGHSEKKPNIDVNVQTTTCGDDNTLQWLNNNFKNKPKIQSKKLNNDKHDGCNDISTLDCFHQKLDNDVVSITTNSVLDEPFNWHVPTEKTSDSSCCSGSITSSSEHYYDIFQCKQRQKHEKCEIHGTHLNMVYAYPRNKSSIQNRIRKDVIQHYGAYNTTGNVNEKSIRIKKIANSKPHLFHQQSGRIAKIMTKEEQVFENYKALGHAKKAHNHLNEYDSNLFFPNRKKNIKIQSYNLKVRDQELHKMIDDIMLLNHRNGSKQSNNETI